ncbi:hypothetical protein NOVO_02385 [Rickettsiales bacterium Ac37b]|nr:hypothetical protein NOVO_02385 [Rickettsiales bacterium Ac37b]
MYKKPIDNLIGEMCNTQKELSGEVLLWRMVITQAFMDASIKSTKKRVYKMNKLQAISWLLRDKKDFYLVCSLAELCPKKVRKFAYQELKIKDLN